MGIRLPYELKNAREARSKFYGAGDFGLVRQVVDRGNGYIRRAGGAADQAYFAVDLINGSKAGDAESGTKDLNCVLTI